MPRFVRVRWTRVGLVLSLLTNLVLAACLTDGQRGVALLAESLAQDREQVRIQQQRLDGVEVRLLNARERGTQAQLKVVRLEALIEALEEDLAEERQLTLEFREAYGRDFNGFLTRPPPVPAIEARVEAVQSDVDPALIILDVGADQRVEKGYHFSIYRGSIFVAKVVVERVTREMSGCRVLFTADGQSVCVGDAGATRLN